MDIKNGGLNVKLISITWTSKMVGPAIQLMFLSEMPLRPSFQASLASTASIWAATGRWVPRDHCTSLDPFFNEGAMRPGLGSIGTEVYWSCISKHFQDSSWSLSPSHSWHTWFKNPFLIFLHVFVRSVFAYLTKTQHLEAKWLPTCHHLHAKWLLIFGGLVLCQVLIFDIDSPACDGAPPAPRIVLLPQMWTQGHCEGMERKGHMRTNIIPEFVQIKRLENMSHLEKWLCSWQKTGGKCKYRVKSSRSTDVKLHHSRRGLNFFIPLTSRDHGWYCWSTLAAPSLKCCRGQKPFGPQAFCQQEQRWDGWGFSPWKCINIYIYNI